MSDEKVTSPSDEGKEKDIVSIKELQEQLQAKDLEVTKVVGERDKAKLSLLDPNYLAYLESEKTKATDKIEDIKEKVKDDPSTAELTKLKADYGQLSKTVQDIAAVMELRDVKEQYPDFEDFREDTIHLLETSTTPLTIRQAFKLAKQNKAEVKTDEEKKAEAKAASEKPTGTPMDDATPKEFKSAEDASEDAWEKTVGKGKDTL